MREEVLDGENSYKCDKCNRKVRATKKYSIQTAPNVLVINLKRFDFTYAGKLTHFVTYPETLSLKTFITENELKTPTQVASAESADSSLSIRNVTYKLYGVLVHLGKCILKNNDAISFHRKSSENKIMIIPCFLLK